MRRGLVLLGKLVFLVGLPAVAIGQDIRGRISLDEAPRRALVVGNDHYPRFPLVNAVNDARAVARQLEDLGFAVDQILDTDLETLERSVDKFVAQLESGDVAVFFYSGHGIQIRGENFMLPVDHDAQDEVDAMHQAFSVNRLLRRMEARDTRLNLLILDACRNNPYRWMRSTSGKGLAHMSAGVGTFIAFATGPGNVASDNPRGRNGLFTSFLLEALKEPCLKLEEVFKQVRRDVHEASAGRQLPWSTSTVIGEFRFRCPSLPPPRSGTMPEPPPTDTVLDPKTGLMWMKRAFVINTTQYDAKKYCQQQNAGTYQDWRLPTRRELRSIYGRDAPKRTALGGRIEVPGFKVWIADEEDVISSEVAYFSFKNGWSRRTDKDSWAAGALCVRGEMR